MSQDISHKPSIQYVVMKEARVQNHPINHTSTERAISETLSCVICHQLVTVGNHAESSSVIEERLIVCVCVCVLGRQMAVCGV